MLMKPLPRRTFLRGLGAAVALPALDAMSPAFGATLTAKKTPTRMAFVYVPNGIIMKDWTPQCEGAGFTLPRTLAPLKPLQDELLALSGLTHHNGRALGDGPGDHARAAASYLTGVHPRKTAGADIQAGLSVDQLAAQEIGRRTRLPSLELACEHGRLAGNCDSGYSCAYSNSISWRSPSTPMPPEVNPRLVFERLFGSGRDGEDAAARARRRFYEKSILDSVSEDARGLQKELGASDRQKLDEYLTAVRQVERRIQLAEKSGRDVVPTIDKPAGIPAEFAEHVRLMYDLLFVAFQTDLTRIATLMVGLEGSNRTYREIGVAGAHHGLSHHKGDEEKIEHLSRINRFHVELFAHLLDKLRSTKEGDGTLLDHTMIVYGSGLSDGNRHYHHDLPLLFAGGRAAGFHPGRHVRYRKETPMANLFLNMLDGLGVDEDCFGDADGELARLTDV